MRYTKGAKIQSINRVLPGPREILVRRSIKN